MGGRTENTSKRRKMVVFVRNCLVKMTLRLSWPLSAVMTMVPMLVRLFRRLLQIKKFMLLVCYSLLNSQDILINNSEKGWLLLLGTHPRYIKKLQKLHKKRSITGPWWVLSTMEVRSQLGWDIASKSKALLITNETFMF